MIAAFAQAEATGKSGTLMKDAVLKNRLLSLTADAFRQSDYGSRSFLALLRSHPELVRVSGDGPPFTVELLAGSVSSRRVEDALTASADLLDRVPVNESLELVRIRSDLWRAVVDYHTGEKYFWDPRNAAVVKQMQPDVTLPLPTLSRTELDDERRKFALEHSEIDAEEWLSRGRGSIKSLPTGLRAEWASKLKQLVLQRIRAWFEGNHLEEPGDLIRASTPRASTAPTPRPSLSTRDVRSLAAELLAEMTEEEVLQLYVPLSAIYRLRRK